MRFQYPLSWIRILGSPPDFSRAYNTPWGQYWIWAFHPQTDGQSERVIQVLEDLLRVCILKLRGNWEEHIALVEFTYNNSHQAIIGMARYKTLYGRRWRTPLCWEEVGDRKLYGADLVQVTTKKVRTIKDRIKIVQDRQKEVCWCEEKTPRV